MIELSRGRSRAVQPYISGSFPAPGQHLSERLRPRLQAFRARHNIAADRRGLDRSCAHGSLASAVPRRAASRKRATVGPSTPRRRPGLSLLPSSRVVGRLLRSRPRRVETNGRSCGSSMKVHTVHPDSGRPRAEPGHCDRGRRPGSVSINREELENPTLRSCTHRTAFRLPHRLCVAGPGLGRESGTACALPLAPPTACPVLRMLASRSGDPCRGRSIVSRSARFGDRPGRTQGIWLILPVVICSSQRLSHACLSASRTKVEPRKAH